MIVLRKTLDLSERILISVCALALAVMVLLGLATVVFRFVVQSSLAFPDELIRYLFIWMIFLGSPVALRRNLHAAIGLFAKQLPELPRRVVLLAATTASGIFFAILLIKGIALSTRVSGQISPALEVSMTWVYAAVPVGAAFMLVYAAELFARQLTMPAHDLVADDS
jgi:TRAP-type C4-dicarboxylate transport system permease small subunit